MPNIKEIYRDGITFISVKNGTLNGCIYIKDKESYIPIELDDTSLNFIKFYPNIMDKLNEGEMIYLPFNTMYLGHHKNEGPYGVEEYFVSSYNSKSSEITEQLVNLDKNIFEDNKEPKRLLKIGNFYHEI